MRKCEKCAYYNRFNNKCYRCHSEHLCQDNCDWYERASETKTDKELSVMENDDLVELYYANLSYSASWENGEAYNDYVYPVKKELEKRGYKIINYKPIKEDQANGK